jgi:ataxin-10
MQVDDESPFLREVALWGVRNLCEGNFSIQQKIEELQIVGTVDTPELQKAGVAIQHDPASGKINIIDRIHE